ncbi:MAG: threonylcarbamoyl-AMP synthase [Planctomycetes bacterium]|nr:threonylcarbamoyl-AMP synthase [Planctomycetota bacterium]
MRAVLQEDGVVAFPTETVYGLAARGDRAPALERLRELKGRPSQMPLTWHVGSSRALQRFPRVSPMALRLVARYWPGPLTLVLPGVPAGLESTAQNGWTGVRLPAHRGTAGILAALEFPIVMTSANLHGAPPATDAEALARAFDGRIDWVLDGGPSRLSESSSVLRLGPGHFELLRPGLFTLEQLRPVAGLRIALVCTGNTCRSPMAEGLARKLLAERLSVRMDEIGPFGFEVVSMGVQASVGQPASRHAVTVMEELGIDLSGHESRAAAAEDVAGFDRVYCMTRGHRAALIGLLPPGKDKRIELLDPQGRDVPDPIGGTREDYLRTAEAIRSYLESRLEEWA